MSVTQISGETFPLVIDQADITAPKFPRDAAWWRGFVPENWITVDVAGDGTVTLDARREGWSWSEATDGWAPDGTQLTDAQFRRRREGVVSWAQCLRAHIND